MQMWRSDPPRMAAARDDLATFHVLALFDQQRLRVRIHRRQPAAVGDDHRPAIAAESLGGVDNLPVAGGADRRAIGHRQIHAFVRPAPAIAKARGQGRMQRP